MSEDCIRCGHHKGDHLHSMTGEAFCDSCDCPEMIFDTDTVTITISREDAELWAAVAGKGSGERIEKMAQACRAALSEGTEEEA